MYRQMIKIEGANIGDKINQVLKTPSYSEESLFDLELNLIVNKITYAILNPCKFFNNLYSFF